MLYFGSNGSTIFSFIVILQRIFGVWFALYLLSLGHALFGERAPNLLEGLLKAIKALTHGAPFSCVLCDVF